MNPEPDRGCWHLLVQRTGDNIRENKKKEFGESDERESHKSMIREKVKIERDRKRENEERN